MKKTYLVGVAGMALFLAACGGAETPAPTAETPPAADVAETEVETAEAPVEVVAEEEAAPEEAAPEEAPVEVAEEEAPAEEPPVEEMAPETETAAADDGAVIIAGFTGDAEKGQRVFTQCRTCHQVQEGRNMVGPSLYGIIGRDSGSVEGFRYSDANANSGITWTEEIMYEYLENPAQYIPGTIMAFPGLRREQDRVDVIAYLKSVPNS
ncbi:MAG: cytochrome c family protein [Pseudomonadota bacterium]